MCLERAGNLWAARTTFSGVGRAAGAGDHSTYAAGGAGLRSWVGGEARGVWVGTVRRVGEVAGWRGLWETESMQPLLAASQAARHTNICRRHLTTIYDGSSPLFMLHQKVVMHAPRFSVTPKCPFVENPEVGVAAESPFTRVALLHSNFD